MELIMTWLARSWFVGIGFIGWGTIILSEANTDGIPSNIAPWATTGLAGLILAWLFFWHLPSKDKQLAELISGKDSQIGTLLNSRDALVRELITATATTDKERRADFKAALDVVVQHCEREFERTNAATKAELDEFGKAIEDLRTVLEGVREAIIRTDRTSKQ